jgi:O-antigen ligase
MAHAEITAPPRLALPALSQGSIGRVSARRSFETIGYGLFGLVVFLLGFDVSEPAPYDFAAALAIPLWLCLGVRLPREAILFPVLLLLYALGILLSTLPYLDQSDTVIWATISFYLVVTGIFFAMFFSDETERRVELALKAFLASCVAAAVAGIMGFFDVLGTYELFTDMDRAMGTFRDPNVFGSFLILGVLYVLRDVITGEGQRPMFGLLLLPLLLVAVLLAFSRGTWFALTIAIIALLWMTFATSLSARVRRRIVMLSLVATLLGSASIAGLLAIDNVRGMFEERAHIVQPYDTGETGRFGQHLRAIPALLDRPNGFGPERYRYMFRFAPHNTYLNSFASGGWIGGLAFLALVLATTYVALRLALRPTPYRRHAQILFATHLTFVLQSFQIDLDHWRHVYLVWGAIWGLEAARVRWLTGMRATGAAARTGAWPPPAIIATR